MKKAFSLGLLCLLFTVTGCISTIQRGLDPAFNAQQNQLEVESMFPPISGFYSWLTNDFIQDTAKGTQALPANVQFKYSPPRFTTNVPVGCVIVQSRPDYWDLFNKRREYLAVFKVQEDVVASFCQSRGYSVSKYKLGFAKELFQYFGLKDITRTTAVNEFYGYSYVVYSGEGNVVMIYTPIIYGEYSTAFKDINTYYWDAIFISGRESEKFLNSLPNSFLADMETK